MIPNETFGERLKELMEEKEVSSKALSNEVSVGLASIYFYRKNEHIPSYSTALKIADFFDCSLEFLFGFDESKKKYNFLQAPPFSSRFKQILKEQGITRYRLCKNLGIAMQTLDDWYNGLYTPDLPHLVQLKKYFGCTLDYLVGREK